MPSVPPPPPSPYAYEQHKQLNYVVSAGQFSVPTFYAKRFPPLFLPKTLLYMLPNIQHVTKILTMHSFTTITNLYIDVIYCQ